MTAGTAPKQQPTNTTTSVSSAGDTKWNLSVGTDPKPTFIILFFFFVKLFRSVHFGYFCMGACVLWEWVRMHTPKDPLVHIWWMWRHTNWVRSVYVEQVAVDIWSVTCIICARSHCEDGCRWDWLCVWRFHTNPPWRCVSCMCAHWSRVSQVKSFTIFYTIWIFRQLCFEKVWYFKSDISVSLLGTFFKFFKVSFILSNVQW